ncbi:MAG: hypothetical protein RL660_775 [Bacteroidota bacterium]|jgi:DNA repair protein RadC
MKKTSIRFWNEDDQPREKAISKGVQALSDAELLAILIGKGTIEANAVEIAKQLYAMHNNNFGALAQRSINELSKSVKGVGPVKAVTIAASLEIARRKSMQTNAIERIKHVEDMVNYFQPLLQHETTEKVYIVALKGTRVLGHQLISHGGFNQAIVDARVVFKALLMFEATSFAIAHNHPSGNAQPSQADTQLTYQLRDAGKILSISLIDHIIVTHTSEYYSFADEGLL